MNHEFYINTRTGADGTVWTMIGGADLAKGSSAAKRLNDHNSPFKDKSIRGIEQPWEKVKVFSVEDYFKVEMAMINKFNEQNSIDTETSGEVFKLAPAVVLYHTEKFLDVEPTYIYNPEIDMLFDRYKDATVDHPEVKTLYLDTLEHHQIRLDYKGNISSLTVKIDANDGIIKRPLFVVRENKVSRVFDGNTRLTYLDNKYPKALDKQDVAVKCIVFPIYLSTTELQDLGYMMNANHEGGEDNSDEDIRARIKLDITLYGKEYAMQEEVKLQYRRLFQRSPHSIGGLVKGAINLANDAKAKEDGLFEKNVERMNMQIDDIQTDNTSAYVRRTDNKNSKLEILDAALEAVKQSKSTVIICFFATDWANFRIMQASLKNAQKRIDYISEVFPTLKFALMQLDQSVDAQGKGE